MKARPKPPASRSRPSGPPDPGNPAAAGWRRAGRSWIELAGLWALVIAWPVYQNIASGPEALTGLGLRRLDLLVIVILVSITVPTLIVLAEYLIGRIAGEASRNHFQAAVIGLLAGLFAWQQLLDNASLVRVAIPLLLAGAAYWAYLRSEFVRSFVLILGIAVPVVIVMFALRYPVTNEVGPHERAVATGALDADTPVVVIVFDELPLAALEDRGGAVNGRLFPNFKALAQTSDRYPEMMGIADQTTFALPSILTGGNPRTRYTREPPPPGLPDFPDNICSLAGSGGFEVQAYEPITDLCPRALGMGSRVTAAIRRGAGATDESRDVRLVPGELAARVADGLAEPFTTPWSEYGSDRDQAVDAYIEKMPGQNRSLSLLHIALPHIEWEYLPDGTRYVSDRFSGVSSLTSPPSRPEVNRDMQQMMLQLAFTDRELGRIVGKMKRDGIWDEALFIVTADHGGAFIPDGSRRILGQGNAGWVVPVPLLIKFPGQQRARVVSGSVDSRDIAPTVFGQLGIKAPPDVAGRSLAGRKRLPERSSIEYHSSLGTVTLSRAKTLKQLEAARLRLNGIFGSELYAVGGRSDLLGSKPSEQPGLRPLVPTEGEPRASGMASWRLTDVDPAGPVLPAYFEAAVEEPAGPSTGTGTRDGTVAVSLNGRIVATTRTWTDPATDRTMTGVTLPPTSFRAGDNEVRVFAVPETSGP